MVVATDSVLFLARIECEGCEVDVAGADQRQSGSRLLIALELSMHDIELEKLRAVEDVLKILSAKWNGYLMVPALPVRVAALIHDVCLEV